MFWILKVFTPKYKPPLGSMTGKVTSIWALNKCLWFLFDIYHGLCLKDFIKFSSINTKYLRCSQWQKWTKKDKVQAPLSEKAHYLCCPDWCKWISLTSTPHSDRYPYTSPGTAHTYVFCIVLATDCKWGFVTGGRICQFSTFLIFIQSFKVVWWSNTNYSLREKALEIFLLCHKYS